QHCHDAATGNGDRVILQDHAVRFDRDDPAGFNEKVAGLGDGVGHAFLPGSLLLLEDIIPAWDGCVTYVPAAADQPPPSPRKRGPGDFDRGRMTACECDVARCRCHDARGKPWTWKALGWPASHPIALGRSPDAEFRAHGCGGAPARALSRLTLACQQVNGPGTLARRGGPREWVRRRTSKAASPAYAGMTTIRQGRGRQRRQRAGWSLHAGDVLAGAGVDADDLVLGHEQRHADH